MISKSEAKRLRAKIQAYVRACIAESWKGGGDPADIPSIDHEYWYRRRELEKMMNLLTEPENTSVNVGVLIDAYADSED